MNRQATNSPAFPLLQHTTQIRVRYQETDGQGRLHHANYLNYFEVGRVELLRAAGYSYRELEKTGIQLVVVEASCEYLRGAGYDDLVSVTTRVVRSRGARIEHHYTVICENETIARGRTVVACIGTDGRVRRLPKWLQLDSQPDLKTEQAGY